MTDSDQQQNYDQDQQAPDDNKASLSHEVIAGAASYEAMKAYENHCDKNGMTNSYLTPFFHSLRPPKHTQPLPSATPRQPVHHFT